jgi:hypothetical protein
VECFRLPACQLPIEFPGAVVDSFNANGFAPCDAVDESMTNVGFE